MIDSKLFDSVYKDKPVVEYKNIFYSQPKSTDELIKTYLPSKLWRLNNLYTIINKQGKPIKLKMNLAQHKVYSANFEHARLLILKSRQLGISTFFLVNFFDDCIFYPYRESGLMAQGMDESNKLLSKIQVLWDNLNPGIKQYLNIETKKNNQKAFGFTNNSEIFIRTSFRSGTLHNLHVSEYAKICARYPDRAQETKLGSFQAIAPGNKVIVESTAEGETDFKFMWDKYDNLTNELTGKDFKNIFLPWTEDPDCNLDIEQSIDPEAEIYFNNLEKETGKILKPSQKYFWIAQKREIGTFIHQEYPATPTEAFWKNLEGTYYTKQFNAYVKERNRILPNLYDPNLPVQVSFDLGMNDDTVLLFFQEYSDGRRYLDTYINNDEDIPHYCQVMDRIAETRGWDLQTYPIILPHDCEVRSLENKKPRYLIFNECGYRHFKVDKSISLQTDRELVRASLQHTWIDSSAKAVIACFLNFGKEYDQRLQVFKDKEKKDKHSHVEAAIRYAELGSVRYRRKTKIKVTKGFDV